MRILTVFLTSFCLLASVASPSFAAPAKGAAKPHVVILTTGGGISGSLFSKSNTEFTVGNISGEAMLLDIKEINDQVDISVESISSLASQDISHAVIYKLAQRINTLLKQKDVDGIVVTHGTDTLEETAYFLNLVTKSKKPVVLVGATRPYNHFSPDGPSNLFDGINVAASTQAVNRGVLVAMNNRIFAARDVIKHSTYGTDSVGGGQMGQVGYVYTGIVKFYYKPVTLHTHLTNFHPGDIRKSPKVVILYAHQEFSLSMINVLTNQNVKGLVIAGTGNGNMSKSLLSLAKEARQNGIVVVRSSRTGSGNVTPASEINDRKLGLITGNNLSPQKARILLKLALSKTKDLVKIQHYFDTH